MNILIIRLSAIGDVAMTVPVIDSVARKYPQVNFTVLSRPFLRPLFSKMPGNVVFEVADPENEYKGIVGIWKLFLRLRKRKIDAVADLHDVLRSKMLRGLFFLTGTKTIHIDKGRQEKKSITRKHNKQIHPLKSTFIRYSEVFSRLGFPADINFVSVFGKGNKGDFENIKPVTGEKNMTWIGIAPFAKHQGKIYPLEKTEEIVSYLAFRENCRLFFFGGGNEEQKILSEWEIKYPRSFSIIGKITGFEQELTLMSHLDVMVSMDSANMHLASLVGTPVISVWGATHPYAGFYGWNQLPENIVQSDLYCRPCSIYGNIPCYRNDYACLVKLPVKAIIDVIEKYLK